MTTNLWSARVLGFDNLGELAESAGPKCHWEPLAWVSCRSCCDDEPLERSACVASTTWVIWLRALAQV